MTTTTYPASALNKIQMKNKNKVDKGKQDAVRERKHRTTKAFVTSLALMSSVTIFVD